MRAVAKPGLEERVRERGREADTLGPRITTARKEAEANPPPRGQRRGRMGQCGRKRGGAI